MEEQTRFEDSKADFSTIYDRPDPCAYYSTLAPLDYSIPELAAPVVGAVHAANPTAGPVLDLCCSYGINAMLWRHRVGFAEFARHCAGDPDLTATRAYLAERDRSPRPDVLGLDLSKPAVDWAVSAGLLADGWAENLEEHEPSPALAAGLADVATLACTGGVGYVTATTFERLLAAMHRPQALHAAWFVLRVFDSADIVAVFDRFGLVTERVPDVTFRQRRFADLGEAEAAVADVRRRGLDPTGKEADGWFHADCFVTRPPGGAALGDLLQGALPTDS